MAHYGTTYGTVFDCGGEPYSPDFAALARAYGVEGVKISSEQQFKHELEKSVSAGKSFVIDVALTNEPLPTAGHWNVNDIYSPNRKVSDVAIP